MTCMSVRSPSSDYQGDSRNPWMTSTVTDSWRGHSGQRTMNPRIQWGRGTHILPGSPSEVSLSYTVYNTQQWRLRFDDFPTPKTEGTRESETVPGVRPPSFDGTQSTGTPFRVFRSLRIEVGGQSPLGSGRWSVHTLEPLPRRDGFGTLLPVSVGELSSDFSLNSVSVGRLDVFRFEDWVPLTVLSTNNNKDDLEPH